MTRLHLLSLIIWTICSGLVVCPETDGPVELLRIVSLATYDRSDIEDIYAYARLKNKKTYDQPQENITPNAKKNICTKILTSSRLEGVVELLDMDTWYRTVKLKVTHSDLLQHLKNDGESSFTYPTEPLTVHLGKCATEETEDPIKTDEKGLPENGFLCLARHVQTKKLVEAYISEEYDVNFGSGDRKVGRFVFDKCVGSDKLVPKFLAEEPAEVIESDPEKLKLRYDLSRSHSRTATNNKEDPICGLKSLERSQVCASVLNSQFFDGTIKHVVVKKPECRLWKDELAFTGEEWLLECLAKSATQDQKDSKKFTYYVSRGETDEDAFVYFLDALKNKIQLLNISKKVRNVPFIEYYL